MTTEPRTVTITRLDNNANGSRAATDVGQRRTGLLLDVAQSVLSELDLGKVLLNVLAGARELTDARYAAIGVLSPDRQSLERFLTSGIDDAVKAKIGDLPRGHGVLGLLIDEPHAVRIGDVSAHPRSYGFPLDHPPMTTFLGVPVVIRGEPWGNLYLTDKAGGEFDEQDEQTITLLAGWAASAVDNARLYEAELTRRGALERVVRGLETTTEIARATGGEMELDRVLELIVRRGRALVEAAGMALLLQDGDELAVAAVAGDVVRDLVGVRVPIAGSVTGAVLRGRHPEQIADVSSRLRFALGEHLQAGAGLLVPLLFRGRALGVLCAFDRVTDGPGFSAEDEQLMEAFAASATTAIATAQNVLQLALRRSLEAAEVERARWARELHDDTLQELAALKLGLASARNATASTPVHGLLADAVTEIDATIGGLRAIIHDLRPVALDALGVVAAVEALVARNQHRTTLQLSLVADLAFESGRATERLTAPIELAAYRLVQEAVTNAIGHSGGTNVHIELWEAGEILTCIVRDDGNGFDRTATHDGFGLIGMEERIALAGGKLDVRSSAAGTEVTFTLTATRRQSGQPGHAG
jgi:signal transduction histidine kinase